MIKFINNNCSEPYQKLRKAYNEALKSNQINIEAILVASYSQDLTEVDARYVNLKIIDDLEFIFFSNYESVKSIQFKTHKQITSVIYWNAINVQIRMKANISKISSHYSDEYFKNRSSDKNALAISSMQSKKIDSYEEVESNYEKILKESNLKQRPKYWGGYTFTPYYFEFWKGHESRLNRRETFTYENEGWKHGFLQP